MKNRSSAYVRHQRFRVINRKKRIIKEQNNYWHYRHEGELSKGKIHCSCWMCSGKTADHGYKISDLRKFTMMDDQVNEYYNS